MTVDAKPDELLGRVVDKYRLARLIGVGGMGRVYEGHHETLGKRSALKFIDRESLSDDAIARFQREAKVASSIESPHIVQIFDVGTSADGLPFIVMELLRGEDLGQRLRREHSLSVHDASVVVAQTLRGLCRAHEVGIVHRDLKPDNIFLEDRDEPGIHVKILDFGVSKVQKEGAFSKTITREGVVVGTPVYMSPEQAQALPIDARSDLFAMGGILFECLTGRPPFEGASYEAIIVAICTQTPPNVKDLVPAVPSAVAAVVSKALSRDPNLRWASADDMLDALSAASGGAISGANRRAATSRTVIRSGSPPEGPETLAAVSTVADLSRRRRGPAPWVLVLGATVTGALLAGLWHVYGSAEVAPSSSPAIAAIAALEDDVAESPSAIVPVSTVEPGPKEEVAQTPTAEPSVATDAPTGALSGSDSASSSGPSTSPRIAISATTVSPRAMTRPPPTVKSERAASPATEPPVGLRVPSAFGDGQLKLKTQ